MTLRAIVLLAVVGMANAAPENCATGANWNGGNAKCASGKCLADTSTKPSEDKLCGGAAWSKCCSECEDITTGVVLVQPTKITDGNTCKQCTTHGKTTSGCTKNKCNPFNLAKCLECSDANKGPDASSLGLALENAHKTNGAQLRGGQCQTCASACAECKYLNTKCTKCKGAGEGVTWEAASTINGISATNGGSCKACDEGKGVKRDGTLSDTPKQGTCANCHADAGAGLCKLCKNDYKKCTECKDKTANELKSGKCQKKAAMEGDPHVTNIRGEAFDVLREGIMDVIVLPRGASPTSPIHHLTVQAKIARASKKMCEATFIEQVSAIGTWLGQGNEITIDSGTLRDMTPLRLKLGNANQWIDWEKVHHVLNADATEIPTTTISSSRDEEKHPTIHVTFDIGGQEDISIQVSLYQHKHFSFLNLSVDGLESYETEVGGILGMDSHALAATPDVECEYKFERVHQAEGVEMTASTMTAHL